MRWAVGLRSLIVRHPSAAIGLGVLGLALAIRLPDLGASCNVDAVLYWFGRTRKFWTALAEGRFAEMYYSPHPGVSIMWFSGASLGAAGILNSEVSERSVVAATAPLAILAGAVAALTVPLLTRILAARGPGSESDESPRLGIALAPRAALLVASLAGTLLATEPFLVAHARTFQLDATATGFVWLGCLFGVLAIFERKARFAAGAGLCFGVAVLTRMLSGTFVVGLGIAYALAFALERPRPLRLLGLYLVIGCVALLTVVALWPALLAAPVETITRLLRNTGQTVGKGHLELSWGQIYEQDPGAAFYGGVMLMRLSPEVLGLALLGLGLAWRLPRRSLAALAALGCVYLPPAVGLLTSAKKADRYMLLFFPFLIVVASLGAVELGRLLLSRGRLAERATVVAASVALLVFGGRIGRLAVIHPVPITWCASYPGLRCEEIITLGQGEGFRDAALWIDANSPVKNPSILSAYAGGAVLTPWLDFRRVREADKAHFILTYIAADQRGQDAATRRHALGEPLHEVRYQGRTYVRIFKGALYPGNKRRRKR
jgi:hypothetical protein